MLALLVAATLTQGGPLICGGGPPVRNANINPLQVTATTVIADGGMFGALTASSVTSGTTVNAATGYSINGSQKVFTGNAASGSLDLRGNAANSTVAVGIGNSATMTTGDILAVYSDSFSTKVFHVVGDGTILTSSSKTSGTCTLNAGSPATCTATVTAGTHCGCFATGTTAAAAIAVAASLSSTTLTCTGPNASAVVVDYLCF